MAALLTLISTHPSISPEEPLEPDVSCLDPVDLVWTGSVELADLEVPGAAVDVDCGF
jgi:hypothetical protein